MAGPEGFVAETGDARVATPGSLVAGQPDPLLAPGAVTFVGRPTVVGGAVLPVLIAVMPAAAAADVLRATRRVVSRHVSPTLRASHIAPGTGLGHKRSLRQLPASERR